MSQGPNWNASGAQPYQQQPYQQPQPQQQPPQWQNSYAPAPYQQPQPGAFPPGPLPGQQQLVPKNPGIALLISFFVPGVGSLFAGKTNTGVIILVGYIISWLLIELLIGIPGVFGFWVWGMIDAYQAAQSWNRAHGLQP